MQVALGLSVHTGWAAAVVAGGDWDRPVVAVRERLEMLGEKDRFVFHRAAEMGPGQAQTWLAQARAEATDRAIAVMKRLVAQHGVKRCAVVAKGGAMLPLADIVAAHPRIHTAEGCFYRDLLAEAAAAAGMQPRIIAPRSLDAKDERLLRVGKVVGRPWTVDWKLAVLAAWGCTRQPDRAP